MIRKLINNIKTEHGFTALELIIILAITAVITGFMLANFRTGDRQKRTSLAADTVTAALRQAQNYALSGKQIPSNATPVSGSDCRNGDNSADYYRVALSASGTTVSSYADHECGISFLIESSNLPQRTRIKSDGLSVTFSSSPLSVGSVDVRFSAPFGRMTINGGTGYADFANLNVTVQATDDAARTKTVRIDGVSGKIGD